MRYDMGTALTAGCVLTLWVLTPLESLADVFWCLYNINVFFCSRADDNAWREKGEGQIYRSFDDQHLFN